MTLYEHVKHGEFLDSTHEKMYSKFHEYVQMG